MPWKVVEIETQEEEATVNLLRREQGGALYKVDELIRITSDGNAKCQPLIVSTAVSSEWISLSLFNDVFIFDGEQSSVVSSLSFESNVDTMAWCPNSQFLVIGDSSGTIHFFSTTLGDVVFTSSLVEIPKGRLNSDAYFSHSMFSSNREGDGVNLTFLSRDGCVFSFNDLPLPELSKALESNDFVSISKLKENIQRKVFKVSDIHNLTSYCVETALALKSSLIVSGTGDISVSIWTNQNLMDVIEADFLEGVGVKKCDVSLDGKYLLILDEESNLSVWDTNALIMLSVPCSAVKEFVLTSGAAMVGGRTVASDAGQVVTLTETNGGNSEVNIYQLPHFQKIYSKEVARSCSLAKSNVQEKVYYTEEYVSKANNNVEGLTFKCLSEAAPEHRVYSLIRKKKFDAALEFSKAFGLDVEFVYKAKASTILADISTKISESDRNPEDKLLSVDQLIDALEETLRMVRSIEFSVECCLTASPPQLQQVHRLLCFAKDKIGKVSAKEKNKFSREMNDVLSSIHRLETFQMVFGDSQFSGHKWHVFSAGCMLGKVTQALSEGKLSSAAIIWVRHHNEFEGEFSCENLQKLLASVRSDLPSSSIVAWLKSHLVPFVICSVSDRNALYVLASWLEHRVVSLEIAEKDDWPNNGLEMATLLFDVVSKCKDENISYISIPTPVIVNQNYGSSLVQVSTKDNEANPVKSLALLVEHLTELKKLHVNYHCKLPLAEFTKETPMGIMFKMLDCVLAVTLIPNVINNQITQYGIQHSFQIDDVLVKYISYKTKQVYSSSSSNTLYEDRFVEITKCIKVRAKRLEAILMLMSWASVPWSSRIEEMVSKAMNDDPSNSSLKMSYRFMEIKKILSHYGIRDIEFSSDLHFKNVVKHMLGTSHKAALEDALRIVETYQCMSKEDVYVIRLKYLCLKGLPDECAQLLIGVSDSRIMSVAQYFLTWVLLVVDEYADDEKDRSERNLVIEAGIHTLEFLQNSGKITDDMKVTLATLKNILALEKEFSISVNNCDYSNVETRNEILSDYLKKSDVPIEGLIKLDDVKVDDLDKLLRLGSLFGLTLVQMQNKIMLQYISDHPNSMTSSTIVICNEWLKQTIHDLSSEEVFTLCMALLQKRVVESEDMLSSTDLDVPEMLYRLACHAATSGEAIHLDVYLELCKLCWLSEMLYVSCESGGLGLSTSVCAEDLLPLWNSASRFRDNGFVLDMDAAFPLHSNFLQSVLLVSKLPAKHLEKLMIACRDLVFYLEENNLHELALHYAIYSLRHLLVFTSLDEAGNIGSHIGHKDTGQNERIAVLHQLGSHGVQHISSMLLNLASKVLHSSAMDCSMALGYLSSIPEDDALQKLKSDFAVDEGHDASQAIAAFSVLLHFAKNLCDKKIVDAVEKLYTDASWHAKLQKLDITCDSLLIGEAKEVNKVLELLLEKPGVDVKVIVEFCNSFSIDVGNTLKTYLKCHFAGSKTVDPDSSETSGSIKNFQDNLVVALSYLSGQSSMSELLALLKDVLLSLPLYDYERLLIVLDEIVKLSRNEDQEVVQRQLEVLNILKSYTRSCFPSEYEEQFQIKELSFGIKEHTAKNLAAKRLPFHPLFYGKPWTIIAPELNDQTVAKLLRLCQILKMQEDQVYITAAKNLVSSCLFEKPTERDASTSSPLSSIYFEKAAHLLSAVNNPEVAVKTGLTLLSRWPQCEERVRAANALVELVLQWKSNCIGDELQPVEKILKTAKELRQGISIQHILHINGVTDDVSYNLKKKPVKLIFHLYETYGCLPEEKRPNVHKIADEVATTSDLNITKVRNRLLMEWQPSSSSRGIRSAECFTVEKRAKDQNNLKRVVYLMQADSAPKNALFLLNFAYRQGPSKLTYESRVRAMYLLFNIASQEVIESVANCSIDDLKNYMKSLVYLSELEHLHLSQTVESFQRCNKEGLVKGLWKNHKDNAHAILLIANICLDSKISDPQIWTNILRQLCHLGLTTYLANLLPRLTQFPNLWQTSNLMKIWTDLAIQSLQKAVYPLSPEEQIVCLRFMQLLQKCPIMTEAVTSSVFEKLLELGLHSYALACLTLLPRKLLSSNLAKLMSVTTPKEILDLISKERALGQCFVNPDVAQALVFDFIHATSTYGSLKDSEHYLKLADYLISTKKFSKMVMTSVKHGELESAIELAQYYDMVGSPLKMKGSHFDVKPAVAGLDDLVAFLKKFRVLNEAVPYLPEFDKPTVPDEKPQLDSGNSHTLDDVDFFDVF